MLSHTQNLIMEITVISARGLKTPSSSTLFSRRRLRPFVTLTAVPPPATNAYKATGGDEQHKCHVYTTRVDEEGGVNSTWGDKFRVPLDSTFFTHRSYLYLQLFARRLIAGETQLGWCQIPAVDVGFPATSGSVRYLSYRLRDRDGTRTDGVVNLAVKIEGSLSSDTRTVIGIPVTAAPSGGVTCQGQLGPSS